MLVTCGFAVLIVMAFVANAAVANWLNQEGNLRALGRSQPHRCIVSARCTLLRRVNRGKSSVSGAGKERKCSRQGEATQGTSMASPAAASAPGFPHDGCAIPSSCLAKMVFCGAKG